MADEQIVTSIVAKADLSSLVSEVHRASASLQQLQRELLASNRAISSSTKLANNLFRDTLTGSGQFSSHFVNLNSDVDKFGKNLDSGRLKLKNYFSTFREHATTQKGMIRELAKEQVMLQNSVLQPLGRNAQGLMQYNVMIPRGLDAVANSGKLARMEMQIMNRALSEGAGSLINWGKNTQWAGRQLTVGLTVPITMFGAAAGKAFKEADQELVRLTKVYGGLAATSSSDLKAIREEVVETAKTLSKTMGASFKDTIALGADIAATGQTGNELLGSIAETTRLAILGEVDRQDAMKATLSIQTAFKQNTQELTESINFLNAVENQTSTTLNDLVEAIPKAGPVIQQLGGDVKDLALYLTAMREGGISASEGANALKSGLASLINPTKQTVGMMSDFGIDVMGMVAKNTGDTTGLLMDLQKALDSLDPLSKARAMEQMFGKFQFARMSALLNNLGKEGSQTLQVLDLMKASTADLASIASRELKMVTESASGKYKRAIEGLKAELADVGEEFLGVATKLINAATKILDFFTKLPDPIKKGLTFLAGFTALVGPLIMLTGLLANFFGYITKGVVQLRAFFQKANGWKMLTPEIIAAEKAALLVENAFYSDAAAAQVLHNALQKLVLDYQNLQAASMKNGVPVNGGMSTVSGNPVMLGGRRVVDPNDPYVGDPNTRAMSHINPRDPNKPATIFGGVPGAIPVNRGISRTPQMYMHDRLPNIEGLTSVKGISTGIVPGEAAKFHALMATLGMQTEQEIAALKKTIMMGGTVSRELLDTFDDILPITQRFAESAATQSALIVQQMRNAEITVEQAKARILALNAQIEADMGSAVGLYAAGRGRTLDLTRAPMMDQPVVDANGQFTLRDLYKKKTNAAVMTEFGRLRGIRTFGAPYSMQTTRMPRFNTGGEVESFSANKTVVSGPSSVGYDDRLGSVPIGGYVLNQAASMDPANAALVAMAPSTYLNDGGNITAALTPREVVFGPQIQRMPELYAAVDAANSGYNFGGQVMKGINSYGKEMSKSAKARVKERNFKRQYREYLKFINNPRYEDDIRVRMIMLDAAELSYHNKLPIDKAINIATSNFDKAKAQAGGSDENFVKIRIKQVQGLERDGMVPRVKDAEGFEKDGKTVYPRSSSKALNWQLNDVRKAMLANKKFAGVHDLIAAIAPTTFLNASDGSPSIGGMHDKAHFARKDLVGYTTSGYMGVGAVIPAGINNVMSTLETIGLSRDVLNLSSADAKENLAIALKKTGLDKFANVDDIYAALQDDGKIKSKADWESGRVVRANKDQKNSLGMLLEAAVKRSKWILAGRPPRPVLVSGAWNAGGMIPGGSISAGRSSYGVVPPLSARLEAIRLAQQARYAEKREADMIKYPWIKEAVAGRDRGSSISPLLKLLAPGKQLDILEQAREMSKATATGSFKDLPPVKYGHMVAPSSGMSFPIPGVSGLYKDSEGRLKFFKGVPNEISAKAEVYGTRMAREVFGLDAPEQTIKTILNPLDPSGKTKLLGVESPFDKKFAGGGTVFTEDEMIRQTIASLVMNNKDLSPSNVYGNVLADVGAAGVFAKASRNTEFAKTLPSMQEQAMINLLAVKGGARKDFAVNTSQLAGSMTSKQYERKMKAAMKKIHPKLIKFVATLPREDRAPYIKLLQRFEDGMEQTDFKTLHGVHVAAKRNSGGPVGGSIQRGRYSYGKTGARRPGNPAARAAWEAEQRAQRERDAEAKRSRASSHQVYGQQALTTGLGREATRTGTTSFYNPGSLIFPQIGSQIKTGLSSVSNAVLKGTIRMNLELLAATNRFGAAYKRSSDLLMSSTKAISGKIISSATSSALKIKSSGSRFYNAIVREQNAFAAKNYPAGHVVPSQGFFGPGFIGKYKDLGDGLQSRKVGSLGFRKTEYLVDGVNMSAKQAKAAGISVPTRANGMPIGAQMGIGMAGSMAGMQLMGQQKVTILGKEMSGMTAGMSVMAATSILPMLPLGRAFKAVKTAAVESKLAVKGFSLSAKGLSSGIAWVGRFAKFLGPIGLIITGLTTVFEIYKKIQNDQQDSKMANYITVTGAEEAGIKYFNLQESMQGYLDKQEAVAIAAKASRFNSIGMPGLPKSVEDMKKVKEEGKALKEVIESLNRSKSIEETKILMANQKAQYIAGGMSVEEANRKLYGALLNSEKAFQAMSILGDGAFGKIIDKATAAEFAVGNLINTINSGPGSTDDWSGDVNAGFEGLINTFSAATDGLIGTKDAMGNIIDEYKAYEMVMSSSEKMYPQFNEAIGYEVLSDINNANKLLGGLLNREDSIKGVIAKWTLFTKGFTQDLSKIDSALAIKLAGFTEALGTSITKLTDSKDSSTTFGGIGSVLEKLKKSIASVSNATQRAAAAAQRSAQEELKLIAKKIKLIDDEKNKKLEAIRATQDASNYALELQKLQIEYQDALSRGDMAAANRAQLDIDQLTRNRQSQLTQQAIEDAANKQKAPLEKAAVAIQDKSERDAAAAAIARDNAASASEIASKITDFQTSYNDLVERGVVASVMPDPERKVEEQKIREALANLVKEIQVSGTGNTALAKSIREAFQKLSIFDKNGNPIPVNTPPAKTTGYPTIGADGKVVTPVGPMNADILKQFNKDMKSVGDMALTITGGTSLDRLRIEMKTALGLLNTNKKQLSFDSDTNKTQVFDGAGLSVRKSATGNSFYINTSDFVKQGLAFLPETILNINGERWVTKQTYQGKVYVYKMADGGKVRGPGTGTSDSIPAMLSHGEYVVKASSVAKYGVRTLDAINSQKFHKGGSVHAHLPDGSLAPSQVSLGDNRYAPVLPTGSVWKPGMMPFLTPPTKNYGIDKIKSPMGSLQRFLDIARSQIGSGHNYRGHDDITPSGERGDPEWDLGISDVNKFTIWGNKKFSLGKDVAWWCGQFVAWVAEKSGVEISDKMHSAWQATQQYKKKGLFNDLVKKNNYKNVKTGDLAWFDYANDEQNPGYRDKIPDHATIVSRSGKDTLSVIGWFGGDAVKEKTYSKKDSDLFGSVSPEFKKPAPKIITDVTHLSTATTPNQSSDTSTALSPTPTPAPTGFAQGGLAALPRLKKKIFESFPKKQYPTRNPGGMGIDKSTPPLIGSGASAYFGGLLGGGGGMMLGYHDGGFVHPHPHDASLPRLKKKIFESFPKKQYPTRNPGGMGIDKSTPPLIGSGASAWFGGLLGGGGGMMVGYHDGGEVHNKTPHPHKEKWWKNGVEVYEIPPTQWRQYVPGYQSSGEGPGSYNSSVGKGMWDGFSIPWLDSLGVKGIHQTFNKIFQGGKNQGVNNAYASSPNKGDYANAALFPLNFAGLGIGKNFTQLLGKSKLAGQIPGQIYESAIEKGLKVEKGQSGINEIYHAVLDGVSGFYKPQLGNMETKREMFGSIFSRAVGLLAPANIPVVTGNFLRPGGIFSPDVAAQGGSALKNIPGSTTGIWGGFDKLSSVEDAISSGYRAAMMSAMRYSDSHDGNLILNPITKQPGLIDFGMILDFFPKGAGNFIPSMFSPLREHVPSLVDAVSDPKRQAFFEGLLKAKDVLSALSKSDIKDMLKASGYKGIDLQKKLKIVTSSIKETIGAMPSAVDDMSFGVPDLPKLPSNAMIGPDGKLTFPSKGFPGVGSSTSDWLKPAVNNVHKLWTTPFKSTSLNWGDVASRISPITPAIKNIRKLWKAKGFHDGGLVGHKHPKNEVRGISPDGKLSTMLSAAESMIGYKEGAEDNDTFFGKWQNDNDSNINSRFISWCGAFMNWVANASGVPLDNMVYTAGGANKFKEKGDYYTADPQVGDMAFFNYQYDNDQRGQDRIQHIGLVRKILSKTMLETIEGNTAEVEPPLVFPKDYVDEGYYDKAKLNRIKDGVFRRNRLYNHPGASIVGFGRPKYKGEETMLGQLVVDGKIPSLINNDMNDPHSLYPATLNKFKGYRDGGVVNSNNSPFLFDSETHRKNNPLIRENYKLEAEGKLKPYTPAILPDRSLITQEEINQILKGRYLPESPEAAEFKALSAMIGSGRDLDFIRKNIKKATSANLPYYNMTPAIGRSAKQLAIGGRSEEFIRHVLGIDDLSIPVPGSQKVAKSDTKPVKLSEGGPANPLTKAFRFFKNAMNNSHNPASAIIMEAINQAGYVGQSALSNLTKGIIPKPTKVQDKSFQEFTQIPGAYRAITNKSSEGPLAEQSLAAQKVLDWSAALGWAIPSGRGAVTGKAALSTAATNKVVNRQGVKVIDRRLPEIANDLMQVTGVKTKALSGYDEVLTVYMQALERSKNRGGSGPFPEIIPGKGSVNIYGSKQWDLRAVSDGFAFKKTLADDIAKIKDIINVLRGKKEIVDNAAYATLDGNVRMPIKSPVRTLFHELGHRDLHLGSKTSQTILGPRFHPNARPGIHEGYADRFSLAARIAFEKGGYKEYVQKHFQHTFANGNSYVTNPGMTLGDDWRFWANGLRTGRAHQVNPQFLRDYVATAGPNLEKSALDKMHMYMQLLQGYSNGPLGDAGRYPSILKMLEEELGPIVNKSKGGLINLPKFEAGINMVPADMLALIHKNEAVVPAHMNPFNPNAATPAIASGSVYNINVELNGTTVTAQDVATQIHKEMRLKEMASGVNRRVGKP